MKREYSCHQCRKVFDSDEAPCRLTCETEASPAHPGKKCPWGGVALWGLVGTRGHTLSRIEAEEEECGCTEQTFICQAMEEDRPIGCKRCCTINVCYGADTPDACVFAQKRDREAYWCWLRPLQRRESEVV